VYWTLADDDADDDDDDVAEAGDDSFEVYWEQTDVEREHNWYNVSGLLHGRTYRLRVAAVNRHGDMMKSDSIEVVVGIHPGNYTLHCDWEKSFILSSPLIAKLRRVLVHFGLYSIIKYSAVKYSLSFFTEQF